MTTGFVFSGFFRWGRGSLGAPIAACESGQSVRKRLVMVYMLALISRLCKGRKEEEEMEFAHRLSVLSQQDGTRTG